MPALTTCSRLLVRQQPRIATALPTTLLRHKHRQSASATFEHGTLVGQKPSTPSKYHRPPQIYMVGVDGSTHSFRAVAAAKHMLNHETQDQLLVAHVISHGPLVPRGDASAPPQGPKRVADDAKSEVQSLEEELHYRVVTQANIPEERYKFLAVTTDVDVDVRDRLLSLISEFNIDYCFMGRKGQSHASRLYIGDTAKYVLEHAPCNVVLVK